MEANPFPSVFTRLAAHDVTTLAISTAVNLEKHEELNNPDFGVGCRYTIKLELYVASRS